MRNLQFSKPAVWMTPFLLMVSILCVAQAPLPEPAPLRELQTSGRGHFSGDAVSLPSSLQVLPGPRTTSKRIRDTRWERLRSGLIAVFREEHRATGGNPLSRSLTHDSSRCRGSYGAGPIKKREIGAAILLGPTLAQAMAISMIGDLNSLAYSREVESSADVSGSDICAAAGYNPWGLVWLFQEFQNADSEQLPQLLSDHPANGSRIQTLETHFRDKPFVFSKFNPDPKSATPFSLPKDASSMQFLRP